jgi:N-acyl amino acid synthase of PEP-CTERM/exosortase system
MHLPEFLNLAAGFSKYFRAVPALDDELRQAVFRIRHAVYCEELGYEPVRADGLESDDFDGQSIHCLLQSVRDGEYVGCVRIVLPKADDPRSALPFERLCGPSLDAALVGSALLARTNIAEVSRLAVINKYRRRKGERKAPAAIDEKDFGTPDRPRFPYVAAGLYLGMIAQARRQGIDTLFMLTERRLARQLARLGVNLRKVGAEVEHRGLRYPSMMSVSEVIDGLSFFVRPLYNTITAEMEAAYQRDARGPSTGGREVTRVASGNPL